MTEGVKNFLHSLGMMKHYPVFNAKGFDLETDLPFLNSYDLEETLMVRCERERDLILSNARRLKVSSEHYVYEWLRRNSLDHYFINFIQSELCDLETVSKIDLPNEELYDELEIVLPGHRKRLERAVLNLCQEMKRRSVAEKPVTKGWWGKPECLPQAKFDFLCVEGTLFAAHDPEKNVKIDFMVDSGSDVSTVQEKTLESLNLELVGPIYSAGIHGGNHTNMYRAQIQIGDEQMAIEVIASNYDSLGSRILRHFRHVIDGNRHIWLKGNYRDPLPAILPVPVKQIKGQKVLAIENKQPSSNDPPNGVAFETQSPFKTTPHSSFTIPTSNQSNSISQPLNQSSELCKGSSPPHSQETLMDSEHINQSQTFSVDTNTKLSESIIMGNSKCDNSLSSSKPASQSLQSSAVDCVSSNNVTNLKGISLPSEQCGLVMNSGAKRSIDNCNEQLDVNPRLPKSMKLVEEASNSSPSLKLPSGVSYNGSAKYHLSHLPVYSIPGSSPNNNKEYTTLPGNSPPLLDTKDEIDHMKAETLNEGCFDPNPHLTSHMNLSISEPFRHLKQDFKYFDVQTQCAAASQKASNDVFNVSTDVVHILSEEDNGNIDDDESKTFRELGKNFLSGSTSTITVSMMDLRTDSIEDL